MAVTKRNVRGLEHIRTQLGRADGTSLSCKVYMRIAALEMETFRRAQERDSARSRLKIVEERLREIEAEKAGLLQSLTDANSGSQTGAARPVPGSTPRRSAASFRLRY
jgi:hypothetical protein